MRRRGVPKIKRFGRISLYYLYMALSFFLYRRVWSGAIVPLNYGPIEGKERQAIILVKVVKTRDIFSLFVYEWHFLLFSAGSAGSWNVSRRDVPKIRKINDAAFSAWHWNEKLLFWRQGKWCVPRGLRTSLTESLKRDRFSPCFLTR